MFGLAKVTSLVLQCDTYSRLYIDPNPNLRPPQEFLTSLEESIVQAYVRSLLFLGFAIQRQRSKINAPFSDIETRVKGLLDCGDDLSQSADNCERQCSHQSRGTAKELLEL